MTRPASSYLLTDLSWVEVRDHLTHDRRMLIPVGACDQYGPHLPIGTGTMVVEAVAERLSEEFGVLRAPALPYGVNVPGTEPFPGAATLREKTLHRSLNDLLSSWEDDGFEEFILLTAHTHDPHVEAIATVTGTNARVRVVEVLGLDLSEFLEAADVPQHGGEALTSLMLYLHPDKVNRERWADFYPFDLDPAKRPRSLKRLPAESAGAVGFPTLASADKGRQILEYVVERIRVKVFLADDDSV